MSLTLVGLPLWLSHWYMVRKHVGRMPVEKRSVVRKLYVYAVLGASIGFVIAGSVDVLRWAFRLEEFAGFPWGSIVVWGAIWVFHWRVEQEEGQATLETKAVRRIYLYAVSLTALVIGASGLGLVLHMVLEEGYEALFTRYVLLSGESGLWREAMRGALAQALVGSAAWGVHWLYFARDDFGSSLREAYLYLFAILGGLTTCLAAAGVMIFAVLAWITGAPSNDVALAHFRFFPTALSSLIIGAGIWGYHWSVARGEAEVSGAGIWAAKRTYGYILTAVGLGAMGIGVARLVNTVVTIIAESGLPRLAGQDLWREPLSMSATLLILGVPLWGIYWTRVQRRVEDDGFLERESPARRVFIFAALGTGVVALLFGASTLLFFLFRDALADSLSRDTLHDARASIDVIVAVAIFLPYYWLVYRNDRMAELDAVSDERKGRPPKAIAVLVREGGDSFVRHLETTLGYEVGVLRWVDSDATLPELTSEESDSLAERIADATGQSVLLVPNGTGVRVLSYD